MTAVPMTNAWPLVATDGVTGMDNDRDFRKWLAALLLPDIKTSNPLGVRNGVLPHNWDASGVTSLRVQAKTTPSMSLDVLAGPLVVERAGQGPYVAWTESTISVTLANSDASNPRIDVVFAHIGDKIGIPTDTQHGGYVDVLTGSPSATPVAPTGLPEGAVVLANVAVAANATTITNANITLKRKGTCVTGGVRRLLEGDSVSDPGRVDGELRYRQAVAPLPALVDFWDGAQLLWRGTQGFTISGVLPGTPDSSNIVRGSVSFAGTTITSVSIPDPGFPYRIKPSCTLQTTAAISTNFLMKVASGTIVGRIINTGSTGLVFDINPASDVVFTGPQTVSLSAGTVVSGTGGWQADVRNKILIDIVPA